MVLLARGELIIYLGHIIATLAPFTLHMVYNLRLNIIYFLKSNLRPLKMNSDVFYNLFHLYDQSHVTIIKFMTTKITLATYHKWVLTSNDQILT